jgi:DNA replication protein DnaC
MKKSEENSQKTVKDGKFIFEGKEWSVDVYCSVCGQPEYISKYEKTEDFGIKHITCRRLKNMEKLSVFTDNFKYKTFENAKCEIEEEKEFHRRAIKFCDNFDVVKEKGLGIMMTGTAGTGKTYLSACIYNRLIFMKKSVINISLAKYLEKLRKIEYNVKWEQIDNEKIMMDALKSADCIIVDDLGNEKITEWGQEKVFNFFNELYNEKKVLVISTNLSKVQMEKHYEILGSNKIVDRLQGTTTMFIYNWKSKRKNDQKIF